MDNHWIKTSERKPTHKDLPVWLYAAHFGGAPGRPVLYEVGMPSIGVDEVYTHWQPATIPAPPPEELTQAGEGRNTMTAPEIEKLIEAVLPGGYNCDPQEIADNLRRYLAPKKLTQAEKDEEAFWRWYHGADEKSCLGAWLAALAWEREQCEQELLLLAYTLPHVPGSYLRLDDVKAFFRARREGGAT